MIIGCFCQSRCHCNVSRWKAEAYAKGRRAYLNGWSRHRYPKSLFATVWDWQHGWLDAQKRNPRSRVNT